MPVLNIQIQPDLEPDLDVEGMLALFGTAAEIADAELEIIEDHEDGWFIDYCFRTRDLVRLWDLLQSNVLDQPRLGAAIARAAIVTCEGPRGADDYLLLHHHDRNVAVDQISNR